MGSKVKKQVKNHIAKLTKLHKSESLKHSRFSRANLTIFAIIFAVIGGYLIYNSFAAISTCSSITYTAPSGAANSVTYTFNKAYTCGQFANGDWFVVPDAPGGTVTITGISPAMSNGRNGVEVNPAQKFYNSPQPWDNRMDYYQAPSVSFPFNAHKDESIVKYVSKNPGGSCSNAVACGQFVAVLTVLDTAPASPDTTFRPPYYGTYKPLLSTSSLQTQSLLELSSNCCSSKITRADAVARTAYTRFQHWGSTIWGGGSYEPTDAYAPDGKAWGGDVFMKDSEVVGWLNLDNACGSGSCSAQEELNAKKPVLVGYVQSGIDLWAAARNNDYLYRGGGGNGAGILFTTTFAAAMLGNTQMKADLNALEPTNYWETQSLYRSAVTGQALWGQPEQFSDPDVAYWEQFQNNVGNGTTRDPYQRIDGGHPIGDSYQGNTSPPLEYAALLMHLMPSIKDSWTGVRDNGNVVYEYGYRWARQHALALPDPCAPYGGTRGVNYGPNGSTVNGVPDCIKGSGRDPGQNGFVPSAGRYSNFMNQMYSAYNNYPTSNPPPPMPGSDTTPPVVSLTAPTAGASVSGASVTLSATASDNVAINNVQFKVDGVAVGSDTSSPYSITWNSTSVANGSHSVTATASDSSGNSTTSSSVSITVTNTGNITIGETTITPSDDNGNANLLLAQQATLSQSSTIQSLSFYITSAAGKLRLGIYDATGPSSGPGSKIAETAEITPTIGWNTASTLTHPTLSAGSYWLAYLPSDNNLAFRKSDTSSVPSKMYNFTYGTLPNTFSTAPQTTLSHWSFYATLTIGGSTAKVGDINNDNQVNITDLSLLLSSYGQTTTQCITNTAFKCDLSTPGDGVVNIFDLSILLSKYGT